MKGGVSRAWPVILIAIAVMAAVALNWWAFAPATGEVLPPVSRASLDSTPDAELEQAALRAIASTLSRYGGAPGRWRRLSGPSRHLYAVTTVEFDLPHNGLAAYLGTSGIPAGDPGLSDFRTGLEAMGHAKAGALVDAILALPTDADPTALGQAQRRLYAELASKPTRTVRIAWIRASLDDIAGPAAVGR